MPALVIGPVTIPVAREGGVRERFRTKTDLTPMFDESMGVLVLPRKRVWEVTTTPVTDDDRTLIDAQTHSTTLPVACSGDALRGAVDCIPEPTGATPTRVDGEIRWVLTFTLHEA